MNETEYLLSVVAEECSESAQRAIKAMRFGLSEIQPGQLDDNQRRLEREMAEAVATFELLGFKIREEDKIAKVEKLKRFMDYSRQIGTLQFDKGEKSLPESDRLNEAMRNALNEIGAASLVASTLPYLQRKISEAAEKVPGLIEKRNDEVLVYPIEKCGKCGREHKLAGVACPCRYT